MKELAIGLNYYINRHGNHSDTFFTYNGGLASCRIQLKPALVAAENLGLESQIWSLDTSRPQDLYNISKAKICILGKLNADSEESLRSCAVANIAATAHLKRKGCSVIMIYSDNHLERTGTLCELYKDLAHQSDAFVCPTKTLAEKVEALTGSRKCVYTIEDPWSLNEFEYTKNNFSEFKLAWFGSGLNIPYLAVELPKILQETSIPSHISISILSSRVAIKKINKFIQNLNYNRSKFSIITTDWNQKNQPFQLEQFLINADAVLIPSDPNDPKKIGVSHNRLVDAARCGCIPITSPMQSYKELSKIALIGNNFPSMIKFAYDNKERLQSKYQILREPMLKRFSPQVNDKKWQDVLKSMLK